MNPGFNKDLYAGALLKAKTQMHFYKVHPVINSELIFTVIPENEYAFFLYKKENQLTKFAEQIKNLGTGDLYAFILGDRIVYQIWYYSNKKSAGDFFDYWEICKS